MSPIYDNKYSKFTYNDIVNIQMTQDWLVHVFEEILVTKWYNGEEMTAGE